MLSQSNPGLPRNGLDLLIEWANEQDQWVRAIAGEVITTRREVSEQSVEGAYSMFLAEKGLSTDAPPNIPRLSAGAASPENVEELRLIRLGTVSGVNALATGQEIAFNPRLTVLFGENATGKTGYVRVLKRVASVRSAQPILGNIHVSSAGKPHAAIEYSLSGAKKSLEWNDETGVPPFTRMNVFDSGAVALHVDDDLTYVYTPSELALFLYVHRAIDSVKIRLERDKDAAAAKAANPFLHRFSRDTTVYTKIETLGPSTSLTEIETLAALTPEEEASLPTLRDRIEALQPQSAESRLQVATSDRDLYDGVFKIAQAAASFSWDKYNASVEEVRKTGERYAVVSKTAFAGDDIPGIFGAAWQEFVVAGDAYLRENGKAEQPQHGDHCPYCLQQLDARALILVRKYHDFCNNEAKRAFDATTETMKLLAERITSLSISTVKEVCERRRANFSEPTSAPLPLVKAITVLTQLERSQSALAAGRAVEESGGLRDAARELMSVAEGEVTKAAEAITNLRKQAEERKKELEAETAKLRVLENRSTLRALLPDISTYVERAQWAGRATPLMGRVASILRSLTEQSKIASKELLDKDFERLFTAECEMLRAPKVRLDFAGRKGQAARKKTLVSDHRLSEILSEGEQKAIALADFLAEAGLQRTTAPVIFDDPVNSLDYKRLQYVVNRIVTLSVTRQTIVFTHNIWFAAEILARFQKNKDECTFYNVLEAEGRIGIVARGTGPRWDTPKTFSARINEILQEAKRGGEVLRSALVEKGYELLRSWCEVFVEQELLHGVTQRYQPNVMMTQLPNIRVDRLDAARTAIFPIFEKACRMMGGHSQPLETLSVRATLQELEEDWSIAQEARKAYLSDA